MACNCRRKGPTVGSAVTIDLEDPQTYLRPRLRVYLACSLTSDEDRPLKDAILAAAERVFTEAGFDVHNPACHTPPGSPHTPAEVYVDDLSHTVNADFI